MSGKEPARKRIFNRQGDRIVLVVLIVLAVITAVINVMNATGLRLTQGAWFVLLPLAVALTLVGWGLSGIVRRIQKPGVKRFVTALTVVAMAILTMLAVQLASMSNLAIPQKYIEMTSPDGQHRLIVMRGLDIDQARVDARRAARLAADPESGEDYVIEDWGYTYTAYAPAVMGLFYKVDSLIEGEVHIGYGSAGELMLDWEEDGAVGHFFIKDPGVADEGEMRARAS